MSNYSLEPIKISTEEFRAAFFDAGDNVCFRIFSDKPGSAFSGLSLDTTQGYFDKLADSLHKHNAQDRGIFFVINFGGHADANIKRINAQFMKNDKLSLEEQLAKIKAFPLEPSLVVKSKNSLHTYWLIKDGKVSTFRRIQQGLIAHFDADPKCVNESRVFRLPGFNHCKDEPYLVECLKYNPELRYSQEELEKHLPVVVEENAPTVISAVQERGTQKGLMLCGLRCNFIKHCKKNAKTLSEPDWYAMITNLALFEGGEAAIHKLSKPYPKYSFQQTQAKINHFHKSGTKPMMCATIAQSGFVCPRHKDGTCKSKSPAGLAYFPLTKEEIRKRLDACNVTNNPLDDIDTARQFINDYLYNIDTNFADAFINYELKVKFGLKAADVKPLISYQKEAYSAFFKNQQSKLNHQGDELPHWYEITEKGGLRFMPGVLADHLTMNAPAFFCGEHYFFYEDGVYVAKSELKAMNYVRRFMKIDRHKTYHQIADAEMQWRMQVDKDVHEVNPNPYLLNYKNGLYNVLTDELQSHDPKILSTIRLGGNYNPTAECPVFLKYLNDSLPESEIPLVQEILGYMMIAINKAQKAFVILGKAESGKSTLLYVVQDVLLRKANCSNLAWQELNEKFATVQLFGKLGNIFADLPSEKIRDTGIFKAITGEDYISAQHKFKEYFSFKPFVRMMFSCEEIPKNYNDRNGGFYRRLIIIRFENVITKEKKDSKLRDKLLLEADGILAWSLIGLKRLMANNYIFSETDRTNADLQKYKADNSSSLSFVNECCTLDAKAEVPRTELYNAFIEYCKDGGLKELSKTQFNKDLDSIGTLTRSSAMGIRTWRGIKLS